MNHPFQQEIIDVFGVDPCTISREQKSMYARLAWRLILSFYRIDNTFISQPRYPGVNGYKYSFNEIARITCCTTEENIRQCIRSASGLVETDRIFARKISDVMSRIVFNQLINGTSVSLKITQPQET